MKKILISAGTRPNFIKITRFKQVIQQFSDVELDIVHTGQHFDDAMANVFFRQFELTPDYFLEIPNGSPHMQIAEIILRLAPLLDEVHPDIVVVPGDVNSTLAAALAANKKCIPVAHLESGLRSFDRSMPEEYNRILTDHMADIMLVTEQSGIDNLINENIDPGRIHFTGNTMIDTLVAFTEQIDASTVIQDYGLNKNAYLLLTMHRPSTVDNAAGLERLLAVVNAMTEEYPVVFPVHPRTSKRFEEFGLTEQIQANKRLQLLPPLDYFSFQCLTKNARSVITDSGGIQEESTYYRVPCITLRNNTERPVTTEMGSNRLCRLSVEDVLQAIHEIKEGRWPEGTIPELWDGHATERIVDVLLKHLS